MLLSISFHLLKTYQTKNGTGKLTAQAEQYWPKIKKPTSSGPLKAKRI